MTAPPASPAHAAADLRLLRAAVFTAVCVVLSAAGHMAASFSAVPLWTLGVACAAVFALAAPLAGRERSLPGIAAGLAVGQIALHTLFAMGQQPMSGTAMNGAGSSGRMSDQAAIALARHLTCGLGSGRVDGGEARRILDAGGFDPATATGLPQGGGAAADPAMAHCLTPSLPMLLGHLLAALAVGWLLRRGEAALWRLVRLSAPAAREVAAQALVGALRGTLKLVRALLTGLGATHGEPPRAPVSYGDDKPGPRTLALHHSVVRRGPPAVALAA